MLSNHSTIILSNLLKQRQNVNVVTQQFGFLMLRHNITVFRNANYDKIIVYPESIEINTTIHTTEIERPIRC